MVVRCTWSETEDVKGGGWNWMERNYVGIVRTWDRPYSGGGCVGNDEMGILRKGTWSRR